MSNPQLEPEHAEPPEEELRQRLDARELSIRPEQNADRENILFGMELLDFLQPRTPPPSGASAPGKQP